MANKFTFQFNNNTLLDFEFEDLKMGIMAASFFQSLPTDCPKCQSPIVFNGYTAISKKQETFGKKYQYFGVRCTGEKGKIHSLNFHEFQDKGVFPFFLKPEDKWNEYTPFVDDALEDKDAGGAQNGGAAVQPVQTPAPASNLPRISQTSGTGPQMTTADFEKLSNLLAKQVTPNGENSWKVANSVVSFDKPNNLRKCNCQNYNPASQMCEHIQAVRIFVNSMEKK